KLRYQDQSPQTGLMGKSLIEFQSTKGDVLPTHKFYMNLFDCSHFSVFNTHNVIVLKLNKADLGSPALGQGVVYRLKVLRGDNSGLANDIRKEMKALNGKLLKTKDKSTRRDIQREHRTLSKEEHKRQQLAITDAYSKKLDNMSFDLVIIDEAAQALEIACWIPLLK
ncbi:hypothetical protein S83_062703, partial [Arachis hypogaea]